MSRPSLLVVVLGPTGSGKTALSLALAEHFGGEIVNCDSVAMYREFEIGTAKPTTAERSRVPHHLLDSVDPTAYITAGEYARQARKVLEEIKLRGSVPIVVGGTGLYLQALLQGLFAGPERSEELRDRLRRRAKNKSSAYLQRLLHRLDPAAAAKIHSNDTPKLIRAIEVPDPSSIAVDNSATSPSKGDVYVGGTSKRLAKAGEEEATAVYKFRPNGQEITTLKRFKVEKGESEKFSEEPIEGLAVNSAGPSMASWLQAVMSQNLVAQRAAWSR